MKAYIVSYVATALVFFAVDLVWLTAMSAALYRPAIGDLLAEKVNIVPAVLFYLVYAAGVIVFAVSPALASGRWTTALIHGALFGFFAYATYDLTNQATLRNWSSLLTVADMAWGTVLTACAATVGYAAAQMLAKAPAG